MTTQQRQSSVETVRFASQDGLQITADFYPAKNPKDLIVLCHRSHSNRGEYRETAPKFNQRGFSCLAIDQRSGMNVFGTINETSARAKERGLATGYLDAQQDCEAAVDYAYTLNGERPIILLGSSYSAALALLIAVGTDKIKAVVALSPGEYLKRIRVAESITALAQPLFATGARKEMQAVRDVVRFVDPKNVTLFTPTAEGFHGSKMLWASVAGYEQYWEALDRFLLHMQS